jgi:hypothetical protein
VCPRTKDIAAKFMPSPPPSISGSARFEYVKNETVEATARNKHLEGRKAPPGDAFYNDSIVGYRSCDRITFDPSAAAPSK